uniref:Uncharacterized protein n=1 Tax=Avena sativa TaxID=4498 RepID=A0ACD5VFE7_AVESA
MEAAISAILGELASRSMSFLVDKYLKRTVAPSKEESVNNLQRLLLRVRVIVEEAEERRITNQAMLHQLSILRKEMYRGYYTLDTCRSQGAAAAIDDQVSRHAFTLSKSNSAKRVCFYSGRSQSVNELQQVLRSLEAIITDVNEFVLFLGSCPRLCRQPYSVYLVLDKCMFGRQVEMERVISFLLQPECHGTQKPCVLPIIGRARAGKTTLVEHACNDERVRAHFSQIVFFTQGDLEDGSLEETLRDGGVVRYQNRGALDAERVLIIAELGGGRYSKRLEENINEDLLGKLYEIRIASGSKIIVTSRSDKIASFGRTEPPLKLEFLTQEAYWYLFKAYAFGSSTDAADHPKLVSIAMEMSRECGGCFLAANIFPRLLRSNPCPRFGSSVLAAIKRLKRNHYLYTAADHRADYQEPALCNPRVSPNCMVLDDYEIPDSVHSSTAPRLSVLDVLFGSARPRGRFDALAWKSQVPPHYSYIYSCEIQRPKCKVVRKKRTGG